MFLGFFHVGHKRLSLLRNLERQILLFKSPKSRGRSKEALVFRDKPCLAEVPLPPYSTPTIPHCVTNARCLKTIGTTVASRTSLCISIFWKSFGHMHKQVCLQSTEIYLSLWFKGWVRKEKCSLGAVEKIAAKECEWQTKQNRVWNWSQIFQNRESTLKVWIKTRDESAIYRLILCCVGITYMQTLKAGSFSPIISHTKTNH